MAEGFPNVFETLDDAQRRLSNGIVKYGDNEFYYVNEVRSVTKDSIYRLYLTTLPSDRLRYDDRPNLPEDHEDFMEVVGGKFIRKKIDSPKFNKFRPFPLGMVNYEGNVAYVTRVPTRHTQQSLSSNMCSQVLINMATNGDTPHSALRVYFGGVEFTEMLKGVYPSFRECITNLSDPDCNNSAAAFNREYAIVRGPVGVLFIANKDGPFGIVKDISSVQISSNKKHLKESLESLGLVVS